MKWERKWYQISVGWEVNQHHYHITISSISKVPFPALSSVSFGRNCAHLWFLSHLLSANGGEERKVYCESLGSGWIVAWMEGWSFELYGNASPQAWQITLAELPHCVLVISHYNRIRRQGIATKLQAFLALSAVYSGVWCVHLCLD